MLRSKPCNLLVAISVIDMAWFLYYFDIINAKMEIKIWMKTKYA